MFTVENCIVDWKTRNAPEAAHEWHKNASLRYTIIALQRNTTNRTGRLCTVEQPNRQRHGKCRFRHILHSNDFFTHHLLFIWNVNTIPPPVSSAMLDCDETRHANRLGGDARNLDSQQGLQWRYRHPTHSLWRRWQIGHHLQYRPHFNIVHTNTKCSVPEVAWFSVNPESSRSTSATARPQSVNIVWILKKEEKRQQNRDATMSDTHTSGASSKDGATAAVQRRVLSKVAKVHLSIQNVNKNIGRLQW